MSVVSSRFSSVSSILTTSGVRAQFKPDKIHKLPKNVKDILCNFTKGNGKKEYDKLIHLFKEGAIIKDNNLAEFLAETMQCISLLDNECKTFVMALLQIDWMNRSPEVIFTYKLFLQNLACMQTFHTNIIIDRLVELFKPTEDNAEHEVGQFKDEDVERLNHIHDILHEILKVVPMSNEILLKSLRSQFPYILHGTYVHEIYIYALLKIPSYAPQLRSDILISIIKRLMILDTNIPHEEANNDKEDDIMDDCTISYNGTTNDENLIKINNDKRKAVHPTARTLDSCMELFLKYMHEFCFTNHVLQLENLWTLYYDIETAFEDVFLRTHASQYVQYIVFYICSFKSIIAEKFIEWLWNKVTNPVVESVLRQTAVCYISSLLATASFISPELVKKTISDLTRWIHEYIISQENSEEDKPHEVFYSICQAFFHLFIARYKHLSNFVESRNEMSFLENLNISKIVTCKLNPLKMCDAKIVEDFAHITFTYDLAYCHAIIENNKRNRLPIFGMKIHLSVSIPNFFPFESYTLEHSGRRISPLFHNNVASIDCRSIKKCE